MKDIIRTRKTVHFYVWYNLAMMTVIFIIGFFVHLSYNPDVSQLLAKFNNDAAFKAGVICGMVLFITVFVGLFWVFYRLIYGILLRRLLCNYKELKKIDF
jgi:dolichyl-phosphate-mannose--protein O-mannosyl transferase